MILFPSDMNGIVNHPWARSASVGVSFPSLAVLYSLFAFFRVIALNSEESVIVLLCKNDVLFFLFAFFPSPTAQNRPWE